MQQPDSPSTPAVLLERQWAERQVAIERAAEALRLKAEEEAEARARFERAVARDGQRLSSTARQAAWGDAASHERIEWGQDTR